MRRMLAGAATLALLELTPAEVTGPRFYSDDPVWTLPDTQNASAVAADELDADFDGIEHMFTRPGDPRGSGPARNVNTLGEVPDSSWFANRARRARLTPEAVLRGPNLTAGPAAGPWTIVSAKDDGIMPGFVVRDAAGLVWFIKFDPPKFPGMASGAEVISTKLLWALGYHVPENHIAALKADDLALDPAATIRTRQGRRPMRPNDISAVLRRAARHPDGHYRVMASRRIDGRPIGPFRFHGVRPDDPNDYIPHEHRRELRGYGTFAAWLNHIDSKSTNTFDALVTEAGRTFVKHYLLDFGSTLGSGGVVPREPYEGSEYLFDGRDALASIFGLGFHVKPWRTLGVFRSPSAGELPVSDRWDPERWKPRYANPAFVRALAQDKFWAARKLQAVTPELVEAAVRSAAYGDAPSAAAVLAFLVDRRRAILARYLPAVNPVVDPVLDGDGTLTFANAAVDAEVARPPDGYRTEWSWFDNASGATTPIGERSSRTTRAAPPGPLASRRGAFLKIAIRASGTNLAPWTRPIDAYFRNDGDVWTLVGLDREARADSRVKYAPTDD